MSTRWEFIRDVQNLSTKVSDLQGFIDALVLLFTFRNAAAFAIQANAVTASPFVVATTGKKNLLVIVDVSENFAAAGADTVSIDVDGTLISAKRFNASAAGRVGGMMIGVIQNLVTGNHNINVKMGNAAADIVQNIIAIEF